MSWGLAARLAARELRGGIKGFRVFLACLALGVAAIAGVGALADALTEGLRREGRTILGGDIEFRLVQRAASPEEMAYLESLGRLSHVVEMRAMAFAAQGPARSVIDLKIIDGSYPLLGRLTLVDGGEADVALKDHAGTKGFLAEAVLTDRLGLKRGDKIRLGAIELELRGVIANEPDRISGNFSIGPRVVIDQATLAATGLVTTGTLANHAYRVLLDQGGNFPSIREDSAKRFPDAGWRLRDASDAAPQIKTFIDRMAMFLVLVGLTALTVGGVGVSNAVKGYLDQKIRVIAILKCVGAPGALIFQVYLIQILALAMVGIVIGLILGSAFPFVALALLGDQIPVPTEARLAPMALGLASLYGLLTATVFALWPLARARDIPPSALFRDLVAPSRRWPRANYLAWMALAATGLVALAITQAADRKLAIGFVVAALGAFVLLRGAAQGLIWLARRMPPAQGAIRRLALTNLYRPGTPAPAIVLSLGLGLTLLVTINAIQANLTNEVQSNLSRRAPSFFFVDIQNDQLAMFRAKAASLAPAEAFASAPQLRGRITKVRGEDVATYQVAPEARWVLKGDRGVTYAANLPKNTSVVEGQFWPEDYRGPPLISFDTDLAHQMNVKIGDTITVNVLGREITGTISNLRRLDWGSAGINFFLMFSPGVFEAAPHTHLATLRIEDPAQEEAAYRALTDAFPNVSAIRVRDAIDQANAMLGKLRGAILAAASITMIAGVLVLGGALAAGQRRRIYEAVVMKVLGMTRREVLTGYTIEFAILGLTAAALATLAGSAAAYVVVVEVMGGRFVFDVLGALQIALISLAATIILGLAGTWFALSQRSAGVLRGL